jgi:hypothetical protein
MPDGGRKVATNDVATHAWLGCSPTHVAVEARTHSGRSRPCHSACSPSTFRDPTRPRGRTARQEFQAAAESTDGVHHSRGRPRASSTRRRLLLDAAVSCGSSPPDPASQKPCPLGGAVAPAASPRMEDRANQVQPKGRSSARAHARGSWRLTTSNRVTTWGLRPTPLGPPLRPADLAAHRRHACKPLAERLMWLAESMP